MWPAHLKNKNNVLLIQISSLFREGNKVKSKGIIIISNSPKKAKSIGMRK